MHLKMGTKKEGKKEAQKRENDTGNETKCGIEDPINSDSWRCAVAMAVERNISDCFLLQEFLEGSSTGRRPEVGVIDFDTFIMKILNEFAKGELNYKYAILLNFSDVLQEAVDYVNKKLDIPVPLLAKIVKALLFYLKEENQIRIEKMANYFPDPIRVMTQRPAKIDLNEAKKDTTKKVDNGVKLKPPSVTKQVTELIKRGEKAKSPQCIQDSPPNSYFNLHVLLTGFYNPDFPLELIKANIPLHAVICIDASRTGMKEDPSFEHKKGKAQKLKRETKSEAIQNFWKRFLKQIWDPKLNFHFKDTIFQVFLPSKLVCEKKKLQEFVYREISYLMYNLSDLKRQLNNYLEHINLTDVQSKENELSPRGGIAWPGNPLNEWFTVPIILRRITDEICGTGMKFRKMFSSDSTDLGETDSVSYEKNFPASKQALRGSCTVGPGWSEELEKRGDINVLKIYFRTKELDLIYGFRSKCVNSYNSENAITEVNCSQATCDFRSEEYGENAEGILLSTEGVFRSYWKKYNNHVENVYGGDNCLYALLMTKVACPFEVPGETPPTVPNESAESILNFGKLENLGREIRKPHFTVTKGLSNTVCREPWEMKRNSRDFFSPEQYKLIRPEKLKASSAPDLRVMPELKIQTLYSSEIFAYESAKNPFENLKEFVKGSLFSNTNSFDFLEFLNKSKLLEKENENWNGYNCVDDAYSHWNDCILLTLHNRKNSHNVHHETFSKTLRTPVGLRDFYEYVLEDEAQWLAIEEESYHTKTFLSNRILPRNSLKQLSDSHFWLTDSLKYRTSDKHLVEKTRSKEIRTEQSSTERGERGKFCIKKMLSGPSMFDGYNVSDMAVQFSGVKTAYYSNDCSMSVQLTERLYEVQELGVHVTQASHTLHLYSYACPEPHLMDPFKFHITSKSGIVIAFSRRLLRLKGDLKSDSTTGIEDEKTSSELSAGTLKEHIPLAIKEDELVFNVSASLPNGLFIQTVRQVVKPCYIKQFYLVDSEEIAVLESSRLFLPNGNVVKLMNNRTVQILKVNATIVTASLSDLISKTESGNFEFRRYEIISGEGQACVVENGVMTSSRRLQVFQRTDVETNEVFFRRRDGTNYLLQSNGTLCVQFKDGTKMSSSLIVQDEMVNAPSEDELNSTVEKEVSEKSDVGDDFIFVFTEVTAEHPDYATVAYNGKRQRWRIVLPYDSAIEIQSNGKCAVEVDKQTKLTVQADLIRMKNISKECKNQCSFTADLSVFEKKEEDTYCHLKDGNGKIFVVEKSSNCYFLDEKKHSEVNDVQEVSLVPPKQPSNTVSEFYSTIPSLRGRKLLRENKYFIVKRDLTGAELFHVQDVKKILRKAQKGSLVFSQNIPGSENRYFVLVSPMSKKKLKTWRVESILPNPKREVGAREKIKSSTYGFPPSWMHPFPKRKFKFVIPHPLTCRVFVETQKTELSPEIGTIDCYYCEMSEENEAKGKPSLVSQEGVEEFLKRLSEDDQDLLKEIYSQAAASLINEKKKLKPTNPEKLEHYLEMSRYYAAMREYHKKCIRYHILPNYFHHPAGMSWHILNELILKLKLPYEKTKQQILPKTVMDTARSSISSSTGSYNEEIEYNLSVSSCQSFSSLGYMSDLSAETAPANLRTVGVCRCKVKAPKAAASSIPVLGNSFPNANTFCESNTEDTVPGICQFQENDVQIFRRKECDPREVSLLSLEDLMYLGFI